MSFRELIENADGVMVCEGCHMAPVPVHLGADDPEPIVWGPCNCEGWRAEEQPELVAMVERYAIDKRGPVER